MKHKKTLCILLALLLLIMLAIGCLFVIKKAYSMYSNLYAEFDKLHDSVQLSFSALDGRMTSLEDTVGTYITHYDFDYSWMRNTPSLIAHACGSINGHDYTNSLEAFRYNYELGHRVFEVDFELTDENVLVATHEKADWYAMTQNDTSVPFTYENFENDLLLNQYHTLNAKDIIQLLKEYPDTYLITDTKHSTRVNTLLQFSQLVHYAQEIDPSILHRIVPQIYSMEMLDWVMTVYPFESVIFTLYQTDWTPESVLKFCEQTGIGFVTMPHNELTQEIADLWASLDLHIGVHTVNNLSAARECIFTGADMIYTDTLPPSDFVD